MKEGSPRDGRWAPKQPYFLPIYTVQYGLPVNDMMSYKRSLSSTDAFLVFIAESQESSSHGASSLATGSSPPQLLVRLSPPNARP